MRKSPKQIKKNNLVNAVIEIDDVEYLINKNTIKAIKSGEKSILLKRLIDQEDKLVSIELIDKSIKKRGIIDYLK